MSPRGGIAAPVIPINRLPSPLSTVSEQQRDAREEQQREHDLAKGCLVNPAEQLEAKPGSTEHARQSHHKKFRCAAGGARRERIREPSVCSPNSGSIAPPGITFSPCIVIRSIATEHQGDDDSSTECKPSRYANTGGHEAKGKSGEAGYERAGKGRKKKQWNFEGGPIHCSLHRKASSACMGSPLNGEAATPPTHDNSSKDTTSLEIASRHNQGSTLGDETKICSLAIPRWAVRRLGVTNENSFNLYRGDRGRIADWDAHVGCPRHRRQSLF